MLVLPAEVLLEGLTTDDLHGEEVLAVRCPAGLVNGGDRRMLEAGQSLCLALEQLDLVFVDVAPSLDDFQCDDAFGALLLGFVNDTHAAFAELSDNPIVTDEEGVGRGGLSGNG